MPYPAAIPLTTANMKVCSPRRPTGEKDAPAGDYELWTQYLIPKRDTVRIINVLTQYYESGQYPEESLQYHFNELQGMEEGGVYIAPHPGEMVGKLILQHVLGVHKDKILYDEDAAMFPEYVKDVFGHIGIPFNDDVWNQLWTTWHVAIHHRRRLARRTEGLPLQRRTDHALLHKALRQQGREAPQH